MEGRGENTRLPGTVVARPRPALGGGVSAELSASGRFWRRQMLTVSVLQPICGCFGDTPPTLTSPCLTHCLLQALTAGSSVTRS